MWHGECTMLDGSRTCYHMSSQVKQTEEREKEECVVLLPQRQHHFLFVETTFLVNPTQLLWTTHGLSMLVRINEQLLPLSSISPQGQRLIGAHRFWRKAAGIVVKQPGVRPQIEPLSCTVPTRAPPKKHGLSLTSQLIDGLTRYRAKERGVLRARAPQEVEGTRSIGFGICRNQRKVIWSGEIGCEPHQYCRWLTSFTWAELGWNEL